MKTATLHSRRPSQEIDAFANGLKRHGIKVRREYRESAGQADLAVVWSARREKITRDQLASGGEVCVLERGYLGDRMRWTSVSFGGGLNNRGEFRGVSDDPARLEKHFGGLMRPWRDNPEGYALLIGQVLGDMSLKALNGRLDGWFPQAVTILKRRGFDVRFRPHPGMLKRGIHETVDSAPRIGGTLEEALDGAAVVVTFNSNTSVDAVLAGVPTIACDEGCMAWPVVAQGMNAELITPDRTRWAAELAWKQWSLEEMASGECWARVGEQHGEVDRVHL